MELCFVIPPFHRSSCLSFFFCSYSLPFFLSFLVILVHTPLSKKNRRPKCINLARKFSSSFQKRWWSLSEKRNPSNETVWKYDLRKNVIEDEKTFWYFLLFISYWIRMRPLIQILFSYFVIYKLLDLYETPYTNIIFLFCYL